MRIVSLMLVVIAGITTGAACRQRAGTTAEATGPMATPPHAAIQNMLDEYQDACRRLDTLAIRRFFPLIPDRQLKAYRKMRRHEVTFEDVQIAIEGERSATVTALLTRVIEPETAGLTGGTHRARELIRLRRIGNSWVIVSFDSVTP